MAEVETTIKHVTSQALSATTNLKTLSARLLEARTKLQRKSYQTKEEIYAAISRQLEALRDREIWLLTQVDTITQLKEEEIQEQLTAATEGLVLLQERLAALLKHPDQPLSDLAETIQRLCDIDHIPMEDPEVYFEAKGDKLRRKIHNFGSVSSANKRPRLDKYSAANHLIPANLPSLMKGLGLTDPSELFAVFNEPRPTAYWLQEQTTTQTSWHTSGPITTPFGTDLVLSQWLVEEDTPRDEPPNDDDIIEMTPINSHDMTDTAFSSGVLERMAAILSSPMEMWLFRDEDQQSCHTQEQTTSYIPEDFQDWLMVEAVEEEMPSKCACIASGERPMDMDIENLASLLCVQNHQPQPKDSDLSSWLVEDECQKGERPHISSVCRGNELCGSFSECVCDDNCAGEGFHISGDKNSLGLVKSDDSSRDVLGRFDEEFVASDWSGYKDDKPFSQPDCKEEGKWLCNESPQEKEASLEEDVSSYLFDKNEESQVADDDSEKDMSVVEGVEKFHSSMTKTSDWMCISEKEDDEMWLFKKEDSVHESQDSNKWLVEDEVDEKSVESVSFSSLPTKSEGLDLSTFADKLSLREWLVAE